MKLDNITFKKFTSFKNGAEIKTEKNRSVGLFFNDDCVFAVFKRADIPKDELEHPSTQTVTKMGAQCTSIKMSHKAAIALKLLLDDYLNKIEKV